MKSLRAIRPTKNPARLRRWTKQGFSLLSVVMVLSMALALVGITPALAVNPAPVQLFILTLPETDALTVLSTINAAAVSPTYTYFSIAIGVSGTYVYYDQWEDGYAADIANPTAGEIYSVGNPDGVQIWGNGESDDGCAPNIAGVAVVCSDANDVLNAGDVIVPFNAVPIPRDSNVPLFDAKDKVGATKSISMARAVWASGSGTLNAFGHEMHSTAEWGLAYEAPVGTNTTNAGQMFEYSGLSIMAAQNGTTVDIDADADGIYETQQILNEGGTYLVSGTLQGARVQSDKPVQVLLVTGDIGSSYASRDMNLLPESSFGSSYWSPVGVDASDSGPTRLYMYNPSDTNSVYITCKYRGAFNYHDAFASQAYNNSDGTLDWSGASWSEENDDGSAATGTIYINTTDDELRFRENSAANDALKRTANLSGYSSASLSFELNGDGIDGADDAIKVQISGDGGANWTDLQTFSTDPGGATFTYDITAYIASNTTVRFIMVGNLETGTGDGERWDIDDVDITVQGNVTLTQLAGTNGTVTLDLADYQAAHCYASLNDGTPTTDLIFGIGTVDTQNSAYDWSFTLFPDAFLSTDALVGLGLGKDPTNVASTENAGAVWVTAACTGGTFVYVDWNNDGTPDLADLNGDGDTSDTVDGLSEATTNNGIPAAYLQSIRLFEPGADAEPYDQTGARVWSRNALGNPATPGCSLALAWGEDPGPASAGSPGLDVGTSVTPLRLLEGTKSLALKTDVDADGLLSPGDIATYNITVKNAGSITITNVYVYDTAPLNTTYVADTTEADTGSGWTAIGQPDLGVLPLSSLPYGYLLGDIDPGETFYVRFDVELEAAVYEELLNCDTVFTDAYDFVRCVTTPVATKDWGDLPDSYGTSAAAFGPRHYPGNLRLGTLFDREYQGQPSTNADEDDLVLSDDEDGIFLSVFTEVSHQLSIDYTCSYGGTGVPWLLAWFDWDNSGTFSAGETTFNTAVVCDGLPHTLTTDWSVFVEPDIRPESIYFRVRLFEGQPALPTLAFLGPAVNGEVEDYYWYGPTAATVSDPSASSEAQSIKIGWETFDESDILGFRLFRSTDPSSQIRLLIYETPATYRGSRRGTTYAYDDADVQLGVRYTYWLEVLLKDGSTLSMAPVEASLELRIFLPAIVR